MKILLINSTYNIGSTGKIVFDLKEYYSKAGHDVYVIYGRHSSVSTDKKVLKSAYELESKICHFISLISGNIYGNMLFSTRKLISLIKKIKPDVIHLHCLNGYFVNIYKLLHFLKTNKIKTVLTNHAEFMYTANCGLSVDCNNWFKSECKNCKKVREFNGKFSLNRTHKFYKKMKKAFNGFNNLIVTNVSPWLTDRSRLSPFFHNLKNVTVLNGINNKILNCNFNPYSKYKISKNSKILLFVTADYNNFIKGSRFIPLIAEKFRSDNIHIVVKSAVRPKNKPQEKNVTIIDEELNNDELMSLYHFADITLLLSIRETFSMIVAESLLQGTPIVGFKSGGPETICIPNYCFFSEYGDIDTLCCNIKNALNCQFKKDSISKAAAKKYSIEYIGNEFLKLYE